MKLTKSDLLTGHKTLTQRDIDIIKDLGFKVELCTPENSLRLV